MTDGGWLPEGKTWWDDEKIKKLMQEQDEEEESFRLPNFSTGKLESYNFSSERVPSDMQCDENLSDFEAPVPEPVKFKRQGPSLDNKGDSKRKRVLDTSHKAPVLLVLDDSESEKDCGNTSDGFLLQEVPPIIEEVQEADLPPPTAIPTLDDIPVLIGNVAQLSERVALMMQEMEKINRRIVNLELWRDFKRLN
jgi:hypothetical protein